MRLLVAGIISVFGRLDADPDRFLPEHCVIDQKLEWSRSRQRHAIEWREACANRHKYLYPGPFQRRQVVDRGVQK
jgi:hypothetical protein